MDATPYQRHEQLATKYPELHKSLLPNELLARVEDIENVDAISEQSTLRALMRLVGAKQVSEIGYTGPPYAAGVVPKGSGVVDARLRLYEAVFGRDSLIVAHILIDHFPRLALSTMLYLGQRQGATTNVFREEQPGRIPHEVRSSDDPVARRLTREKGWQWPYYGSVDATCLWLLLVLRLVRREPASLAMAVGNGRTVADCVALAYHWLWGRLNGTPLGLLESRPMFEGSLESQVWKDRWDSYSHADGSLATPGTIASVEVQAYVYDALRGAVELASLDPRCAPKSVDGAGPEIAQLRDHAQHIRIEVMKRFWVVDTTEPFFALGLDRDARGNPRALAVRASNMGHLLTSSLLDDADRESVARREASVRSLFSSEMLCSAGIRTLSSSEVRFRAGSYHNGSSWLWDTYWISRGLDRHGLHHLAGELRRRLLVACNACRGFPEFVRGDEGPVQSNTRIVETIDPTGRLNRLEQPPQVMQAWTVAAVHAAKWHGKSKPTQRSSNWPLERELLALLS